VAARFLVDAMLTIYREGYVDSDRLKKLDVFSSLPDEELDRLAGVVGEVSIDEGEDLVRAGTQPYQLFAIEEGKVDIKRDDETLATIGPGEVVGERGIVKRGLRNASAVATESVRAIFLTADQMRKLRREHPEVEERLQSILEERGE
jgi:CRP/FNR family cyclic AMP-dependent transcriptional regulator